MITFEDVSLGYGKNILLPHLNFTIQEGDYLGIVGPNGVGKTTLLKAILGLQKPLEGKISHTRTTPLVFGYVPQAQTVDDYFPLTALDIVTMALAKGSNKEKIALSMTALEKVSMAEHAPRLYRDFSGGQKRRTLFARALVLSPDVLVLDEPTNAMDMAAQQAVMDLMDELHVTRKKENPLTILLVSHILNVVVNHVHTIALVGDKRLEMGLVNEVVRTETLRDLFKATVTVGEIEGKKVVY